MIAYASRTGTKRNLAALRSAGWRLIVSAAASLRHEGFPYALDNGAWSYYQRGLPFNEDAFAKALAKMGAAADWVALPDIVGGGSASLALSLSWMDRVLNVADRALIPVQDGMTANDVAPHVGLSRVGLFVGGTTAWKWSTLPQWALLARQSGCWLHVGRVNTRRRIVLCGALGATSFDGTSASRYASTVPLLDWSRRQFSLALTLEELCPQG